ncbi:MAG: tRNA 2-thiocytidine biosynthesis protein TtcA [Clostridiales bacterium]|nr:tRNA 2-thiocytidine biosynthesis protein TtcA [Clostridiales bacterium]
MAKVLEKFQEIERSIITTYRKSIWSPFVYAVKKYRLIEAGDKIAVCISGGKDSMLLAKLMQELKRHSEVPFELVFLVMDPGYNLANRKRIEENSKLLNVPITIFESDVFEASDVASGADSPCYLCARMRRGHLYSKAKELGCNKIALGHHKSDVIETTLMGMLYGGQLQGMLPKLKSTNFNGMELIRPMYCILEEDIIRWQKYNDLEFIACACKFVKGATEEVLPVFSARKRVKELIAELKKEHENVENCIFQSIHNVQLDTLAEYKQDGVKKSFLDKFEKKD